MTIYPTLHHPSQVLSLSINYNSDSINDHNRDLLHRLVCRNVSQILIREGTHAFELPIETSAFGTVVEEFGLAGKPETVVSGTHKRQKAVLE